MVLNTLKCNHHLTTLGLKGFKYRIQFMSISLINNIQSAQYFERKNNTVERCVGTDGDNVQSIVADFTDLAVLIMHQINEVRRRLRLFNDHFTCRLMEDHLIEHVDDL